jgi:uncharacterized protein YfbU (UPF0304 family)
VISCEKYKKILNKGEKKLTDEQIQQVIDLLEFYAKLSVSSYKNSQKV